MEAGASTWRELLGRDHMFIFNKHLSRRTLLRGVGTAIALPMLDAMIPVRALGSASAVTRLAFVYFPHGAVMSEWTTPAAESRVATPGRILEPLALFADRISIVSGVESRHAYGPVHALTPGTWLSGRSPRYGETADVRRTIGEWTTVDQIAAAHLGRGTRLSSIELASEPARTITTGPWEGKYDSSYAATLSFQAGTPRKMEVNPRRTFNRLFAADGTADVPGRASVLDLVSDDANHFASGLGARDRTRLRDYLDCIRDIERRVKRVESIEPGIESGDVASEEAFTLRLRLMFDLMALAFRADITRVASCMMAAETSAMTYRHVGAPDPFHLVSHHQNDPAKIEALVRIQRYHSGEFARFLQTLADMPDGDGSLLDHSLILYGSNMSDSQRHDDYPLPLAIAGGGCGALRPGNHMPGGKRTPLSDVLLTLLRRADVPITSLGDSTGRRIEL